MQSNTLSRPGGTDENRRGHLSPVLVALLLPVLLGGGPSFAYASLSRSPQRAAGRSSSLVWVPDVRERLELLERHGDRGFERGQSAEPPGEAPSFGLPRIPTPRSEERER